MKVYIGTDSEGQACVTREKDPVNVYGPWQADYIQKRATAETTAAVEAARTAGATEILVHDLGFIRGVSPGGLILHYDDLPRGIRIAQGGAPLHRVIDASFDAVILLGFHAMAGVEDGVMAHTFSSAEIENMWLNGRRIGEIAVFALQYGLFGVPVVMVSGDEAGCQEAQEWLGDVEVAAVKKGLGTHWAISLHPADADDLIREKTKAALGRVKDFKPFSMPPPFELRVDCFTEEQAQKRAKEEGSELVGPKSVLVRTDTPLDFTKQMTAAASWSWLGTGELDS
jgi:D-amino peptidase